MAPTPWGWERGPPGSVAETLPSVSLPGAGSSPTRQFPGLNEGRQPATSVLMISQGFSGVP